MRCNGTLIQASHELVMSLHRDRMSVHGIWKLGNELRQCDLNTGLLQL